PLWLVFLRAIERHGGGILMQPGRRESVALQRLEGQGAKDLVEIGRKERIKAMPQAIIIEGGTREARLPPRSHATLFEPSPSLVKGMMPIQKREHQGCDPGTTRAPMRRVRRDETVNDRGDLQAPSDTQDQRQMRDGMTVLH